MHTLKLLRHFNREHFHFSLITLFERPSLPSLYNTVPHDVEVYRLHFSGPYNGGQWKALYVILKRICPDVVVSSMFSANAIVRLLKPFFSYKVITREHNTYEEKKLYHRLIDCVLALFSEIILAVSSMVADFISKQAWIKREKIIVVHNGVDCEAIHTFLKEKGEDEVYRVRNEIALNDNEKIILNVARLKPQKNHTLLIDAFELFAQTHPLHHLVIVGNGIERDALTAYIQKRGLQQKVHLLGYRDDVFAWYAASDFFVLTSKREGFPNVGVEALAFGLPMISTRVPGVDEFLVDDKNGFIVASNVLDLANKMNSIAEDPKKYEQSCKKTAQLFDIRKIAKAYETLFYSTI